MTEWDRRHRKSSHRLTAFNLVKLCLGITFLSIPKAIDQAGVFGALIGACYTTMVNIFAVYLLIKARNRFKSDRNLVDFVDLGARLYGESARVWFLLMLFFCNVFFLMCYVIFFGEQLDIIVCKEFEARKCGR